MNTQRITPIIAAASFAFLLIFATPFQADAKIKSDSAITADVQQVLGKLGDTVQVRTENGKVFLRGSVTYMDDANRAEWLARRVYGVRSINADIAYTISNSGN